MTETAIATGPSIRAVCRIINQNSCGSGSICGWSEDGESYILTNAHVAGTRVGRVVQVDVESLGKRISATVIRAAYSNQVIADWALLKTKGGFQEIKPVWLSKKPPVGSHYTKGFPRCRAHGGTDITTHRIRNDGVWLWLPDAIGGQSGSGVWSDADNFQRGLLTWSWTDGGRRYGAGQTTTWIYRQNRSFSLVGFPKPPGLEELTDEDFDFADIDRSECDDPVVEEGFFIAESREVAIRDFPIWAEDQEPEPEPPEPEPPEPGPEPDKFHKWLIDTQIDYHRDEEELHEAYRKKFESMLSTGGNGSGEDPSGPTFGL